jgi:hypothetical protein
MKNTSKTLATILGTAIIAGGGAYTLTGADASNLQTELDAKTAQVEQIKLEKIATGRDFIYSQITSGRTPVFTGAMTSEEMAEAYIEAYKASGGDMNYLLERIGRGETVDLKSEIIVLSAQKGEMLSCSPK